MTAVKGRKVVSSREHKEEAGSLRVRISDLQGEEEREKIPHPSSITDAHPENSRWES